MALEHANTDGIEVSAVDLKDVRSIRTLCNKVPMQNIATYNRHLWRDDE